jgi:hypothetical protein
MVAFGVPNAHENDAERAVQAGMDLLAVAARLRPPAGAPIEVQAAVATGPVIVGEPSARAARLRFAAPPNALIIGAATRSLVGGAFESERLPTVAKDAAGRPVVAYRALRRSPVRVRSASMRGEWLTPFVGRREELSRLKRLWRKTALGEGQVAFIVGEPGIGKSRIVGELHGVLGDDRRAWVYWRASQLLMNAPLHPIAGWARQRFGDAEVEASTRLANLDLALSRAGLNAQECAPLLAPLVNAPPPDDRAPALAPDERRRRLQAAIVDWALASGRSRATSSGVPPDRTSSTIRRRNSGGQAER